MGGWGGVLEGKKCISLFFYVFLLSFLFITNAQETRNKKENEMKKAKIQITHTHTHTLKIYHSNT